MSGARPPNPIRFGSGRIDGRHGRFITGRRHCRVSWANGSRPSGPQGSPSTTAHARGKTS
ncbi:hypothetical protein Tchl_0985 [Thauera chlorobenzoica]|uniref:Uncharacterized protein n=1 Tax=Thauera chlorobenzoica TaxID=96773 RepID=A0A1L6FAP7_9RHOO|nr:hypothetical protein Tchl_0985 [Thauera chlorobenzoica]